MRSRVPVIAAGGIVDGRGIAAAFALGAAGVQLGTAYLDCPEATISPVHRAALAEPDRRDRHHQCAERTPGALDPHALRARARTAQRRHPQLSAGHARARCRSAPRPKPKAPAISRCYGPVSPARPNRNLGAGELTKALADEGLAELRRLASR